MYEEKLLKLGFTPTEAKVYLALLSKGKAKAGEIILSTKLPRSAVYTALKEFVTRELVTETEIQGVQTFTINNPTQLVNELEVKKEYATNLAKQLGELQELPSREVVVYEGVEGIERSAEKNLLAQSGDTVYFLGPSKFGIQNDLEDFWRRFHARRAKKGIKSKILYDRSTDQSVLDSRNKMPNSEARYLPFGMQMPIWFTMAGDYISIVVPGEEPLLVFSIKSRAAADGMKKYFEFLWNLAKTLPIERKGMMANKSE